MTSKSAPAVKAPETSDAPEVFLFESDYPSLVVFVDGQYFVRFVDGKAEAREGDPALAALRSCPEVREI